MKILPCDLGEWRTIALMQMRATSAQMQHSGYSRSARAAAAQAPLSKKNLPAVPFDKKNGGLWTRLMMGGTGLSPEAAREAMRGLSGVFGGIAGGMGGGSIGFLLPGLLLASTHELVPGLILTALGAGMATFGLRLPRYMATQYATKPLTLAEAQNCVKAADNSTEKAYWNLIAEALLQPSLPNERTENEVRAALQTLGEAIDKLPRVSAPHLSPEVLRNEAQKAYADADAETDPLIAASFRRRAEAQEKTAQSAQKSVLLLRRADALRSEIEAQIEALRMGLSGFDTGLGDALQNQEAAQNAAAHLNQLAQSVQSVAREAGSLLNARDEVAAWTEETQAAQTPLPLPTRPTETPKTEEVITVGRAGR